MKIIIGNLVIEKDTDDIVKVIESNKQIIYDKEMPYIVDEVISILEFTGQKVTKDKAMSLVDIYFETYFACLITKVKKLKFDISSDTKKMIYSKILTDEMKKQVKK